MKMLKMSKEHNIDRQIRNRLDGFEKAPPPEVFDAIMSGLNPPKRRIIPFYWRVAAGIAILTAIGLGVLWIDFSPEQVIETLNQQAANAGTEQAKTVMKADASQKTESTARENAGTDLPPASQDPMIALIKPGPLLSSSPEIHDSESVSEDTSREISG